MTGDDGTTGRERVLEEARREYRQRDARRRDFSEERRRADRAIHLRTMDAYAACLKAAGLLPLGARSVLDVGCGRDDFLIRCREQWGQEKGALCGIDLMDDRVEEMRRTAPYLDVRCGGADRLAWPDGSFDLVHQSMLLTSVLDADMRAAIASEMGRVTKPGGHVLWYDFVWNPGNRATVGMPLRRVRELFPAWQVLHGRRITLLPPLARRLARLPEALIRGLEAARLLNPFLLVLLRKPPSGR